MIASFFLLKEGMPYSITKRMALEYNRVAPDKVIAYAKDEYQAVQLWELMKLEAISFRLVNTEIGEIKCLSFKDLGD